MARKPLKCAPADDECYCDFESREFFGCVNREHASPCPQAPRPASPPMCEAERGADFNREDAMRY